ncbi:hypothetical protein BOX15_Mlig025766g1 [Macrostomum lignano]|uniref:Uncharacterized protein n=2 Tax=Macrostomum lignano TaxID=282301 RepID=A0A267DW83_9PLAT|nr:hypothetical protein BOX15_Mlig025766g1 [Macrostomum lignano]
MVLEATVICVDNSDYARNGDFVPTRLLAQQDAVSLVCHSKKSNAENTVGLICMAGAEVLVTLSPDAQKVMSRLQSVQPRGSIQFSTSIRIAHLALRHRQSRNQRMRIVAFVGSPIAEDEKDLIRLGKRLKKENVSLDVVNFGEEEANQTKLTAMLDAVNGKDGTGSHLVTVTAGSMLHDSLMVSPIVVGEDGAGSLPPGYGGGYDFGVDAQDDPELALALRVSMEEQRARQEQQNANQEGSGSLAGGVVAASTGAGTGAGSEAPRNPEEAMLARVMGGADTGVSMDTDIDMLASMTEDEQIAMALRMSLQPELGAETPAPTASAAAAAAGGAGTASGAASGSSSEGRLDPPSKKIKVDPSEDLKSGSAAADDDEALEDPEFLESVLQGLPGVDPKSAEVQAALRNRKRDKDGGNEGGSGGGGGGGAA